jgi:hypothetical protein
LLALLPLNCFFQFLFLYFSVTFFGSHINSISNQHSGNYQRLCNLLEFTKNRQFHHQNWGLCCMSDDNLVSITQTVCVCLETDQNRMSISHLQKAFKLQYCHHKTSSSWSPNGFFPATIKIGNVPWASHNMNSTVHTVTKYLVNIPQNVGTNENYTSLPSTQTPPDIISHHLLQIQYSYNRAIGPFKNLALQNFCLLCNFFTRATNC